MIGQNRLQVRYADTSARGLAFSLTAGLQEPLARCDRRIGDRGVSVRLLGASHQVVVDDGTDRLCETVACLPGMDAPLPDTVVEDGYTFASRIEPCDTDRMQSIVTELGHRVDRHLAAGDPAVMGHFPGLPLAITAVIATAHADALAWQTWHTYPQCSELVVTSSELRRTPEPGR
ncbi:DUF2617 family protein [Gordonia hankookensis]|uniref:DUF2617 family protein n=1 Tax=Gordonia hankookensis TaxID=589403 RepID=A0ABR7WAI1_9ACTN|nr:DUF2617 family protein [Gordonia hankookensis]MBD1319819.1 DUF2617 family protein [Gordonia hankookensis]